MKIESTRIGSEYDAFFIAEAGVNHNGSIERAKKLIDVAATSGADAVKFQTFSVDRLVSKDASTASYQESSTGEDEQYELLKRYELDRSDHKELIRYCKESSITFLSTPFDPESAKMLKELDVSALKIGSGELDNHPFLRSIAGLGLPLIISTGMGSIKEVQEAYDVLLSTNPNVDVAFLHCTSAYPTDPKDVNLRAMQTMIETLSTPVGLSDHTTLPETPALATTAGATILEKHFTLDSSLPGPDHETSLEPAELEQAVNLVDVATKLRGDSKKQPVSAELETRNVARKSLHAAKKLRAGSKLSESDIKIVRPADGISPKKYQSVLGTAVSTDIKKGEPIREEMIRNYRE